MSASTTLNVTRKQAKTILLTHIATVASDEELALFMSSLSKNRGQTVQIVPESEVRDEALV